MARNENVVDEPEDEKKIEIVSIEEYMTKIKDNIETDMSKLNLDIYTHSCTDKSVMKTLFITGHECYICKQENDEKKKFALEKFMALGENYKEKVEERKL